MYLKQTNVVQSLFILHDRSFVPWWVHEFGPGRDYGVFYCKRFLLLISPLPPPKTRKMVLTSFFFFCEYSSFHLLTYLMDSIYIVMLCVDSIYFVTILELSFVAYLTHHISSVFQSILKNKVGFGNNFQFPFVCRQAHSSISTRLEMASDRVKTSEFDFWKNGI